ncbi:MAG: FkbM family methyltransferase [Bacteroidota bacterium]
MKSAWLEKLEQLERLAHAGRWRRWWQQPWRYSQAMYWLKWTYPRTGHTQLRSVYTFFDTELQLRLPAGMDIYLLGGKTHDSEIRLARFIIQQLKAGDTLIDVGAHFGFFTLLAAKIVGEKGRVIAFEAAPSTFQILEQNTAPFSQIHIEQKAISDTNEQLTFYEFPTLYSEYNSLATTAFDDTDWKQQAQHIKVEAITLSDYISRHSLRPNLIKIDVEGAERKVIQGLRDFLERSAYTLVVEVTQLHLETHLAMENDLREMGYLPFKITAEGRLESISGIRPLLGQQSIDSDNVVFQKVMT